MCAHMDLSSISHRTSFSDFPDEIVCVIASFLPPQGLNALSCINKRSYQCLTEMELSDHLELLFQQVTQINTSLDTKTKLYKYVYLTHVSSADLKKESIGKIQRTNALLYPIR